VLWSVGTPMVQGDIFDLICENNPVLDVPLDEDAWRDRFSPEYIERTKAEYKKMGMLREYKREFELVLADGDTQLFDMDRVSIVGEDAVPKDLTWFMCVDGAFSDKTGADMSAVVLVGLSEDGKWYVHAEGGRWKPSETAEHIVRLASDFNVIDIGMETGSSFIAISEHLERVMLAQQQYFNVIELKHGGRSKISRISALEPVVNMRLLHIIDNGEHAEMLVEQMELTDSFSCAAKHDDLLDALAYFVAMDMYWDENSNVVYERSDYEDMYS